MTAVPPTPTEPDFREYAAGLEQQVAELVIQNGRLSATITTLSAHVTTLEGIIHDHDPPGS